MASAIKRVDQIRRIVRLKQVMSRWKSMSLGGRFILSHTDTESDSNSSSSSGSTRRIPSGHLAVYVGDERRRFVIPTRYLNLPIFVSLLKKAEEEFGFNFHGGLVFPCDVGFFRGILKVLEKDEQRYGKMEVDEFFMKFSEVGTDPCKKGNNFCNGFTPLSPLLQKARA